MDEKTVEKKSLEDLFEELEDIITKLEGDDLPLETAFSLYEAGVRLTGLCEKEIDTIEKKVLKLSEEGGTDEFS